MPRLEIFAVAALSILMTSSAMADDIPADSGARYAVSFSVRVAGVETASGRTLVREDGATRMSLCAGSDCYGFEAELSEAPGDKLLLHAKVSRNNEILQHPRLLMNRTGTARMEMSPDGLNGLYVNISPVD